MQDQPNKPGASAAEQSLPRATTAALVVAVITLIICSTEMVPGWGLIGLGWDKSTFYLIGVGVGAAAGVVIGKYRVMGAVSGAVAMAGALFCTGIVLDNMNTVPKMLLVLAGGIGALPGVIVYLAYAKLREKLTGQGTQTAESAPDTAEVEPA
jgi:hypothetical protein